MAHLPRCIMIVDVQAAFSIPPKILADIDEYSQSFERRIFTRFVNPMRSIFRQKLGRDSCAPGSPDLRLLIEPKPRELVIDKKGYGLSDAQVCKLKKSGVSNVVVCGMDTDACVLGVMFSLVDGGVECRIAPPKYCYSSQNLDTEARKLIEVQFSRID